MEPISSTINDIVKKVNLTLDSSLCEKHNIQLMNSTFGKFCTLCTKEQIDKENEMLVKKMTEKRTAEEKDKNRIVFEKESMLADKRIKDVTFTSYVPTTEEAKENRKKAYFYMQQFQKGEVFNLFFTGNCGSGKTHLAYAIAKEVAKDKSVLFVTMGELLRKIKSTFKKGSDLTEDDIINRLTRVSLLVIDDLGAEIGSLDSESVASNFINRVLFDVLDGRQGKSTIFTTNFTGKQIEEKYDERSFSRMFNNYEVVIFKETKDFRKKKMKF